MSCTSASTASVGIVSSAMTRIEETARNLSYIGIQSMKRSVSGIKFLPQASIIERIVAMSSPHLIGPLTMTQPMMKRMQTKAPT